MAISKNEPLCSDSSSRPGSCPYIQRQICQFWECVRTESHQIEVELGSESLRSQVLQFSFADLTVGHAGSRVASPELADVGPGWFAVERELTNGDKAVVFKHLARGRIVQRDPRMQPGESVLCGGELAHLTHRRCGQPLPSGPLPDPV